MYKVSNKKPFITEMEILAIIFNFKVFLVTLPVRI